MKRRKVKNSILKAIFKRCFQQRNWNSPFRKTLNISKNSTRVIVNMNFIMTTTNISRYNRKHNGVQKKRPGFMMSKLKIPKSKKQKLKFNRIIRNLLKNPIRKSGKRANKL